MILRVVGTLAAAISFAAWAGAAVAQYAPSPYPGAYGAPPQDDDEFDDLPGVYPAPYETRPSAYPPEERPAYDRRAAPGVAEPYRAERPVSGPYGERAPMSPVERGMGPTDEGRPGLRPPADLAGRPPADVAPGRGPALAALPPDDQPEEGELKELPPHLKRQLVDYPSREPAGTLVVDTANTHLYLVMGGGKAMRYGIGVGREGFTWAGRERVSRMTEWPDWHPPAQMIERQPYLPRFMAGGALSRQDALSHPRHQPALDDRLLRLVRLHPPAQRRRRGPVPARHRRLASGGAAWQAAGIRCHRGDTARGRPLSPAQQTIRR
jgi:lipoprotein-anchoring transpeptidase ErfK/SrfK